MIKIPNPFEITDSHTEWSVVAFVMENIVNNIIKEKHYDLGPARVEKIVESFGGVEKAKEAIKQLQNYLYG